MIDHFWKTLFEKQHYNSTLAEHDDDNQGNQ